MNVEDFTLNKDANDNVFVTFAESPTKTQKHSEEGYDVLWLFKGNLSRKPEVLKLSGPFSLVCSDNPSTTDVWHKSLPE